MMVIESVDKKDQKYWEYIKKSLCPYKVSTYKMPACHDEIAPHISAARFIEEEEPMQQSLTRLATIAGLALLGLSPINGASAADDLSGPIVLQDRGAFFVGGQVFHTPAQSGNPIGPAGIKEYPNDDDIMINQMYVEYSIPVDSKSRVPIILMHGCCLSAMSYDDTPDGRMGWTEYFLRKRYPVYTPDQVGRARSGFDATVINEVRLGKRPPGDLPDIFTLGAKTAWDNFRFGPEAGVPWPDVQYPVEAMPVLAAQVMPDLNALLPMPNPSYKALSDLAIKAGGAVIFGHSESGHFPMEAAMADPAGVRGIVSIEGHCFDWTDEQIKRMVDVPTLIVFGDHIGGSKVSGPFWTMHLESCQRFARKLNDLGGHAEIMMLPDHGLKGNTHMLMQDKNNLEVADLILGWVNKNVKQEHDEPKLNNKREALAAK